MFPPVYAVLAADSGVTSKLGSGASMRLWRNRAPDQTPSHGKQYATWFLVSGVPENHLSGLPSADRMSTQIDCWAQTDADCEALAKSIRDAAEPHAHLTGYVTHEREAVTDLYRISLQFDWFVDRDEPSSE
jgi:hypothetical protein